MQYIFALPCSSGSFYISLLLCIVEVVLLHVLCCPVLCLYCPSSAVAAASFNSSDVQHQLLENHRVSKKIAISAFFSLSTSSMGGRNVWLQCRHCLRWTHNTHSIARFLSTFVLGKNYGAFFRYNLQLGRRFLLNFTIRKSIRSGCWHDNKSQQ